MSASLKTTLRSLAALAVTVALPAAALPFVAAYLERAPAAQGGLAEEGVAWRAPDSGPTLEVSLPAEAPSPAEPPASWDRPLAILPGPAPESEPLAATDAGLAPPAPPTSASPAEAAERLFALQEELKALGAEYLRLERTSDSPPQYRCLCEMPLPTHPQYRRPFSAVSSDPLRAMEQVRDDVAAWRGAVE